MAREGTPATIAPHLVVLDVDSTLINEEVIDLLASHAGTSAQVAAITARAMNGQIDFAESLRARVKTLAGTSADACRLVGERITVTKGAQELIAAVQSAGGAVGVVSGGFHEILDPLAARLGLDYWRANRLESVDGVLTGGLVGEIIDAAAKEQALHQWARESGIPLTRTVAVGDGANDLRMMAAAGLSVAFDAKPAVRAEADICLDTRDLSQILGLIGMDATGDSR